MTAMPMMLRKARGLIAVIALLLTASCAHADEAVVPATPDIQIQLGHAQWAESIAYSRDGRYVLTGSTDNSMKLWDMATGKEIRTFKGHSDSVNSVAISPDGLYGLSGSSDTTLKLWDIASGRELRSFAGHKRGVTSVAFTPDGKQALSGSTDATMKLWDVGTGAVIRTFSGHAGGVNAVVLSPDGRCALSGSADRTMKLWDVETGALIRTFSGHTGEIYSVAFSPDGTRALSGATDNAMRLWDVASGAELHVFADNYAAVTGVAFSPDGKSALSALWNFNLRLWDLGTGKELRTLPANYVHTAVFSPDGKSVLSGSYSCLELWDAGTGKCTKTIARHSSPLYAVAVSPDGRYALAGSSENTAILWDLRAGMRAGIFVGHSNYVVSVAFSPDGTRALTGSWDKTVRLWDVATRREIRRFEGNTNQVMSVAFSPDGRFVISGGEKTILLWEADTGTLVRTFSGLSSFVSSVAFSPDGTRVLSGCMDKTLKLWDRETGAQLWSVDLGSDQVNCVACSPDGRRVLAAVGPLIRLFDAANGRETGALRGHGKTVRSAVFSRDGKHILSGSFDNTLILWDVASGRVERVYRGHADGVLSVAFLPDERHFVSASWDSTTRLWDSDTCAWTAFVANTYNSQWLVFDSSGYWDGSADCSDFVAMSRGLECWNIDQFAARNNRPDLILRDLPGSDPEAARYYRSLYLKRLRKLGFVDAAGKVDETQLSADYHVPEARILQTVRDGKLIDVTFSLSDEIRPLKSYSVYVNDVPLFGSSGKAVPPETAGHLVATERIELTSGDNKIEISCMNDNGQESYRALALASYDKPVKGSLWFIGFGVSDYLNNAPPELDTRDFEKVLKSQKLKEAQDFIAKAYMNEGKTYRIRGGMDAGARTELEKMFADLPEYPVIRDLGFAHKDAQDLAESLRARQDGFTDVHTYVFVNEKATVDAVRAAKGLLACAKPDDTLVLFIAGHGLHDRDPEATYYFLTHETDLRKLSTTSANFELLEDILQGVAPRKKLFLMDTCESGEVDAEEAAGEMGLEQGSRGIRARAIDRRGIKTVAAKTAVRTYLFERDRFIANDLVRRSGSIVFSSCRGGEFSYEDSSVGNGFFTHAIMEALAAEKSLPVPSLEARVSKEVADMSSGLQNPTVDRDNIYQKFGL